jgi:hypothetical protein
MSLDGRWRRRLRAITVQGSIGLDFIAFISFIPVHPVHPRRKEPRMMPWRWNKLRRRTRLFISTGMNRMDGDEGDKSNEIKANTPPHEYFAPNADTFSFGMT